MQVQITELFELGSDVSQLLQPASAREILAALLSSLRDAHWAAALGKQGLSQRVPQLVWQQSVAMSSRAHLCRVNDFVLLL